MTANDGVTDGEWWTEDEERERGMNRDEHGRFLGQWNSLNDVIVDSCICENLQNITIQRIILM